MLHNPINLKIHLLVKLGYVLFFVFARNRIDSCMLSPLDRRIPLLYSISLL